MDNNRSIAKGTRILSIAGKGSDIPKYNFIEQEEKEVASLKLKYYRWLSHLFVFFCVLSMLVFMSSSLALFRLIPMLHIDPFLVIEQDESNEIVRNEAISLDMASKDLIMKTFIKQYVIIRNTVINDMSEMYSRWAPGGIVNYLSSWPVFYKFNEMTIEPLEKFTSNNTVKEVEIINVNRLGGKRSPVWKVDFKIYEIIPAEQNKDKVQSVKESNWTASVTAYLFRERMFVGRRLINPLGFTVVRYSQSRVDV